MAFQFSILNTPNQLLNRIQSNVQAAFNQITGPFVGGQLLQNVIVGTTATVINQPLGRQPKIWVLCDQQASATVWRTAWNATSITLQASSKCTVSIWVN